MIFAILLLAAATPADLEKSCQAGKARACDELGNLFHDGFGVHRDDARAAELFRKACKGKSRDGCADDARASALGEGQTANAKAALPRLEQMCKAGNARACGNLGDLFVRHRQSRGPVRPPPGRPAGRHPGGRSIVAGL